MTTLQEVNKYLEKNLIKERLFKGEGYYYFGEGESHKWKSTMICVNSLKYFNMHSIMKEYLELSNVLHCPEIL